jgi:hypothetical protein
MAAKPTLLLWTWRKGRRFETKGEAKKKLKVWKRWYERLGWRIMGNESDGYIAYAPDFTSEDWRVPSERRPEPNPKVHSAALREEGQGYVAPPEHDWPRRFREGVAEDA